MPKKWTRIAIVALLILLPVILHAGYRRWTALPGTITIATGTASGLYRQVSADLADQIQRRFPKLNVVTVKTRGSLDNLRLLREGKADFAMYQPGTLELLSGIDHAEAAKVAFVANLYLQPTHWVVRRDAGIKTPEDLRGKRVAVGLPESGDYAVSRMLLEHFALDEDSIDAKHFDYARLRQGFEDGTLDAAFITIGVQAPIFQQLFEAPVCDLLGIPCAEALARKHVFLSKHELPQGLYRSQSPQVPALPLETVALGAQLLVREEVPAKLVEEVTRLVLSENFSRKHELGELFERGTEFASHKPEFAVHPGAWGVYSPGETIPRNYEGWEALYSLVASAVIAAFLGLRWFRQARSRSVEHKFDRYVQSLLKIERRQLTMDDTAEPADIEDLQNLLDAVTYLRQGALGELTAHELNEDRAAVCFIQMCHALSDKINAKLSRQRLDKRFDQLTETLSELSERNAPRGTDGGE
jgi:hypothetical protein